MMRDSGCGIKSAVEGLPPKGGVPNRDGSRGLSPTDEVYGVIPSYLRNFKE